MAISLTTDGLRLDYRNTLQTSASGTYPIGTAIIGDANLTFPGTWTRMGVNVFDAHIGSTFGSKSIAIRIK